jgi:hypothetical protein
MESATDTAPANGGVGIARRWRPYLGWIVAAAFTISGTIHIVHPITFTSIVPHFLPLRTELVYASGGAELICAVGLCGVAIGGPGSLARCCSSLSGRPISRTPLQPRTL